MKQLVTLVATLIVLACLIGGSVLGKLTAILLVAGLILWLGSLILKDSWDSIQTFLGATFIGAGLCLITVVYFNLRDPATVAKLHLSLNRSKMVFYRHHLHREITPESLAGHRNEIAVATKRLAKLHDFQAKAIALEKEYDQSLRWDATGLGEERRHFERILSSTRRSLTNDVELLLWRSLAFTGSCELYKQGKMEFLKGI